MIVSQTHHKFKVKDWIESIIASLVESQFCCICKSSLQREMIPLSQWMDLATEVRIYQTLSYVTIEKRDKEDGLHRSDVISISFIEDLESLVSQAHSYYSQHLCTCTRDQDTTRHGNTNIIFKSNLLNWSRNVNLNDTWVNTFRENEPAIVYY